MKKHGKKIGVCKTNDSSNKKSAKSVRYEFQFVDVLSEDVVMLRSLYILEFVLIGRLNRLSECREALLLATNWDKFNGFSWVDIVFNHLFDSLNKDYLHMREVTNVLAIKKQRNQLKLREDERVRYQILGFSLTFQV